MEINLKYLYHFTSRKNFLKMNTKKGGLAISPTADGCFKNGLNGIFMFSFENFAKNWRYSPNWDGHLGCSLLQQARKNTDNIVCLKIPFEKLDKNKIIVRNQNNLMTYKNLGLKFREQVIWGEPLSEQNYQPISEAVEFIYTGGKIPIDDTEVVGMVNCKNIFNNLAVKSKSAFWEKIMECIFKNDWEAFRAQYNNMFRF